MRHRHILIFGADGQLGRALLQRLSGGPCGVTGLSRADAELTRPAEIRAAIRGALPDIILNAAAYTAVDKAELEPALAEQINGEAVAVMAEEAARHAMLFVHYSTDYVFNGRKTGAYVETDAPHPLSAYGHTKLAGEVAAEKYPHHMIFRTAWLFSETGACFPRTMIELAQSHPGLKVVADQYGAPTPASLVADVTARIVQHPDTGPAGLYHLTAGGVTTWCDFARFILERAQKQGLALKAGPDAVSEITSAEYPHITHRAYVAARPLNSQLNCRKLCDTFKLSLPDWQAAAIPVLDKIIAGKIHEAA